MNSQPIRLTLYCIGHVPSFKNSKLVVRNRPITKPQYQEWMEKAVASFTSQLRYASQMRGTGTTTARPQLSWIASWLPLDDSRKWIVSFSVNTRLVSKGNEGADIEIRNIKP